MPKFRVLFAALLAVPAFAASVAVVAPPGLRGPAAHGVSKLTASLSRAGFTVERVTPQTADFVIVAAVKAGMPGGREAIEIRRGNVGGKPALLLTGSDDRGLMYAALDTADRIAWTPGAKDPFANVRDVAEKPYLPERGISMYTMQRAWFESRLYDENHWKRYFDLLARSRINTFTVIFGYENGGFMAPLYPYFFDVAGFPGVKLTGIMKQQQERNTAAFQAMIRIAHEHGIDVIAGVWDHIYRGGVQAGGIAGASENAGKEIPGLVTGLDARKRGAIHASGAAPVYGGFFRHRRPGVSDAQRIRPQARRDAGVLAPGVRHAGRSQAGYARRRCGPRNSPTRSLTTPWRRD